jgi:hypothetical protein
MSMDFSKIAEQAMQMQQEMQRLQEEAAKETVDATAGGGMVKVTANGAGEIVSITIDPKAIDPDDPELLADMVTAAVNEALRSAQSLVQSKMGQMIPPGLEGLLPGM